MKIRQTILFLLFIITGGKSLFADSFFIVPFVNESWKLMLLNTLMFLPMGFFVPIFIKKIKWNYGKAIIAGALISLMIEFVQVVFAGRIGDIDDIIFNTLGFLIGYILENLLQKNLLKEKSYIYYIYGLTPDTYCCQSNHHCQQIL